jgi:hypothetical protein
MKIDLFVVRAFRLRMLARGAKGTKHAKVLLKMANRRLLAFARQGNEARQDCYCNRPLFHPMLIPGVLRSLGAPGGILCRTARTRPDFHSLTRKQHLSSTESSAAFQGSLRYGSHAEKRLDTSPGHKRLTTLPLTQELLFHGTPSSHNLYVPVRVLYFYV